VLASLAFGGTLVIAGYAGGRETEVDVTDIIWKAATIRGFTFRLFAQQTVAAANATLLEFLKEGKLRPTISRVFPLSQAAEAVRYLIEDRQRRRCESSKTYAVSTEVQWEVGRIRFGFRAVLGRRRSEGASNGGLFHSSPYRAFQRVVEPARDRSNSVIIELSEQG
jgi:hypothetical protein